METQTPGLDFTSVKAGTSSPGQRSGGGRVGGCAGVRQWVVVVLIFSWYQVVCVCVCVIGREEEREM